MDLIKLNKIKVFVIIGIDNAEKLTKQELLIDIILYLDTRKSANSDDLKDTINYAEVTVEIKKHIENNQFNLIETVAEQCAELILRKFLIKKVEVIITKKPRDLSNYLESVSVHILR